MDSKDPSPTRTLLNLGCGPFVKPSSWQDCDGSWNVLASRLPLGLGWLARKLLRHKGVSFPTHVNYVNVTKRLPFRDATVDAVYFSHVLEHLYLDEGRHLVSESFRILKAGGVIRVLVPDLESFVRVYHDEKSHGNAEACLNLNKILMYRPLSGELGLLRKLYTALTDFHSHKFMYDKYYLSEQLQKAGFTDVRCVGFCESLIPEVSEIESEDRINPGIGFGVEAVRPVR